MKSLKGILLKIRDKVKKPLVAFSLVLILVGCVFLVIQKVNNRKYDKAVTAVVTGVSTMKDSDGKFRYQAHCEYEVGGKTYTSDTGWRSKEYNDGDEVVVHINSDEPGKKNGFGFLKAAVAFFFFGVACFMVGMWT